MKKCEKVRKSAKNYETILPFSCCPLVFSDFTTVVVFLDDRQITHLICVRLRHLLYDLFRGGLGPLFRRTTRRRPTTPPQSHIAMF